MHNWRLLLLLILSLFQLILSEQRFFDGRECASSGTSLTETHSLHENNKIKSISENYRLNNLREDRRKNQRYEVRDAELTVRRFTGERQLRRYGVAPDHQAIDINDRQLYKTVRYVNRDVERPTVNEINQNNLEFENVGLRKSLEARLSFRKTQHKSGEHFGSKLKPNTHHTGIRKYRFDVTRPQVLDRREHVRNNERRIRIEDTREKNDINHNPFTRKIYFKDEHKTRNAREKLTVSTEPDVRHRDVRIENKHITLSLDRKSANHNIRQNEASRMSNKNTIAENERADVRNVERYSRDKIRKRAISIERSASQSNAKIVTNTYVVQSHKDRNINVGDKRNEIRNSERYERNIVRENSIRQTDERIITDKRFDYHVEQNTRLTNVNDYYTEISNTKAYEMGNKRERFDASDRDVRQSDARTVIGFNRPQAQQRTEVRGKRTEIRNSDIDAKNFVHERAIPRILNVGQSDIRNVRDTVSNTERYFRDNTRQSTVSIERTLRGESDTKALSSKKVTRSQQNVRNNIGNIDRNSINESRGRAISLVRERRLLNARRNMDRCISRMRQELDINVRNERTNPENYGSYRREDSHNRTVLSKGDVRIDVRRVTDIRQSSNREELNTRKIKDVSANINKNERYSRENMHKRSIFIKQQVQTTRPTIINVRMISDSRSYMDITNNERSLKEYSQKVPMTVASDRDIRQTNERKTTERHGILKRDERDSNLKYNRNNILHAERFSRVPVQNGVRIVMVERFVPNRDERKAHARYEYSDNRNAERYVRADTRESGASTQHRVRHDVSRLTDIYSVRSRCLSSNLYERPISTVRDERRLNLQKIPVVRVAYGQLDTETNTERTVDQERSTRYVRIMNEQTRILNNQNKPAIDGSKKYTYAADGSHENEVSIERTVHQTRTIKTDKQIARAQDECSMDMRDERVMKRISAVRITRKRASQNYRTEENSRIQKSNQDMWRTDLNLKREKEYDIHGVYRSSKIISRFLDMERDSSRRNTEFPNELRTMNRNERNKVSVIAAESTDKVSSTLVYWKHLFYVLQGIYIFGVFMQILRQKEIDKKTSTVNWLNPAIHIKVD